MRLRWNAPAGACSSLVLLLGAVILVMACGGDGDPTCPGGSSVTSADLHTAANVYAVSDVHTGSHAHASAYRDGGTDSYARADAHIDASRPRPRGVDRPL